MGLNIKYLTIILMVKYFIYEPCISRSLKVFYDSKAAYAAGGLSRRRHMRQCNVANSMVCVSTSRLIYPWLQRTGIPYV